MLHLFCWPCSVMFLQVQGDEHFHSGFQQVAVQDPGALAVTQREDGRGKEEEGPSNVATVYAGGLGIRSTAWRVNLC